MLGRASLIARDRAVRVVRALGHGGRVRERAARRDDAVAARAGPRRGPPRRLLVACLAATSLSRPEATLLVGAIVGVARDRSACASARWRAAAWWLAPLAAPRALARREPAARRQLLPEHRRREEPLLPAGLRLDVLVGRGPDARPAACCAGLFWDATSPLVWPQASSLVLFARRCGARRVVGAAREAATSSARSIVVAPFADDARGDRVVGAVELSELSLHRAGVAAADDSRRLACSRRRVAARRDAERVGVHAWRVAAVVIVVVALFVRAARPRLVADMKLFAQGAMDTNTQVVAIGKYVHRKLPDAIDDVSRRRRDRVLRRRPRLRHARPRHEPPGRASRTTARARGSSSSRRCRPSERPTHFAYYPGWMGTQRVLRRGAAAHAAAPRASSRAGSSAKATCRSSSRTGITFGTGERPLNDHTGWTVVDRIDIADLASERAHDWRGRIGRRKLRRSDGAVVAGRARDRRARARDRRRPHDPRRRRALHGPCRSGKADAHRAAHRRPAQLSAGTRRSSKPIEIDAVRRGQEAARPAHDRAAGRRVLGADVQPAAARAADREPSFAVEATGIYRVFHWFVLQPE